MPSATPAFSPPTVITRPAMRLWHVQVGQFNAYVIADRESTAVRAAISDREFVEPGETINCDVVELVGPPRALIGWWPTPASA